MVFLLSLIIIFLMTFFIDHMNFQIFFNLDLAIKNKYSYRENAGARGYTPFGKETALGETVPDLKEFWHHGPVVDSTYDPRIMRNVQVDEVDNFNNVLDELF